MTKIEVVDKNKQPVKQVKSIVELRSEIQTYFDLTIALDNMKRNFIRSPQLNVDDETKGYSIKTSRDIWFTIINSTKPLEPKTNHEEDTLARIYKVIERFAIDGEYPLLQQLCNYLGVGMDDFFGILGTQGHPDRDAYMWAYNVFESAAQMNAIRGNGNANARQWIDKSREHKIATEDKLELAIEARKIDKLDEIGAELARELIEGGD